MEGTVELRIAGVVRLLADLENRAEEDRDGGQCPYDLDGEREVPDERDGCIQGPDGRQVEGGGVLEEVVRTVADQRELGALSRVLRIVFV